MVRSVALILLAFACSVANAKARPAVRRSAPPAKAKISAPAFPAQSLHRRSPYVGAAVADVTTGRTLFSDNANATAYPASVTKLMTLLLVVEDVRAKRYAFTTPVTATPDVYKSEPSWVGLKVGDVMTVGDLCQALMVESANDAAMALAVQSAGSFEAFVAKMNARAAQLGMAKTRYYNPNGLPPKAGKRYPWKSFNVSTAADQLKLALVMVKMPEVIRFTSVKTCDLIKTPTGYRVAVTRRTNEPTAVSAVRPGEKLVNKPLRNHNNIMVKDALKIINFDGREAVDGLKTGYINAGGSSVVLTGQRKGRRIVVVVLGSLSSKERDDQARNLMGNALDAIGL